MGHRSVPQPVDDPDPFWHAVDRHRPPLLERVAGTVAPLRSWLLVAVGLAVVAGAGWWLLRPGAPPVERALPSAASGDAAPAAAAAASPSGGGVAGSAPVTSSTSAPPRVVAQAAGAVAEPGVYALDAGARIEDLVEAAGGLTPDADADRVNLAAPVVDGERVWLPRRGEPSAPEVVAGAGGGTAPTGGSGAGSSGPVAATPDQPVDLNSATAEQLDALPGVGPATATAILAYRDEHGRFGSVDELLEVRGIGEAKLEQLRPLVRV